MTALEKLHQVLEIQDVIRRMWASENSNALREKQGDIDELLSKLINLIVDEM